MNVPRTITLLFFLDYNEIIIIICTYEPGPWHSGIWKPGNQAATPFRHNIGQGTVDLD